MIELDGFTLLSPVGRGGMGEVWLGEHVASQRRVAIKVLSSARARDDRHQRSFRREARAIAGLDHPNIVDVHDYGLIPEETAKAARGRLTAGTPYMVMEYVGGGTLNSWRQKLEWGQLRAVLLSLLDALAHAHARQVIHRDLKPGNVLVGAHADSVKLTDFGLAHAVDREGLTMTSPAGGMGGTPAYMAPEQFVGDPRDVGPWSDLYALGCMVYSLLAGAPPFGRKPWLEVANGHLHRSPPRLEVPIQVPRGFEDWVLRLLEKDAAKRYQRAADAAWDLCELDDPTELMPRRNQQEDENGPFAKAHQTQTTLVWGDRFAKSRQRPEEAPTQLEILRVVRSRVPPMTLNWRGPERRYQPPLGTGLFEVLALPLVGREREREAVWNALRQVREEGRTRVVVIRGPGGAGSSRLADWACTRADELGAAIVLRAEHSPIGTDQDGMGPMVARWARAIGIDGRDAIKQRIESQLDLIGQSDAKLARDLAEVVRRSGKDESGSGVHSLRLHHVAQRYETFRALLGKIGADRPVLAWIDDAQWGLDAIEFVDWLVRAESQPAALVILTIQDDALPAKSAEAAVLAELLKQPGSAAIQLGPLDQAERATLLRDVLELSPELAARVDGRTEGNAQFAVQLVTEWIRRNEVARTKSGYKLRRGVKLELPDSLHAAWSQAIDALLETREPGDAVALELAAVLGRQVRTATWLAACARAGVTPSDGLVDALVSRQLARARDPDEGWTFLHGLVHESVLRRSRESGRWADQHRICAAILQDPEHPADPERLARHLAEAGEDAEALPQIRAAITNSIASGEYRGTEALLGDLDGMLERLGADDEDPRRAWSHVFRARMLRLGRHGKEAVVEATRAEQLARAGSDREALLEALLERARVETRIGTPAQAADRLSEAAQLARAMVDPLKVAEVEAEQGTALGRMGEPTQAKELFMRAIRTYRAQGRTDLAAEVWLGLAEIGRGTGRLDLARKWSSEARRCFEEQGNRWGVAAALNTEADLLRLSGDLAGAEKMFRDVLKRYDELGIAGGAVARLNLAMVLLATERWEEASAEFQRFKVDAPGTYPLARAVSHAGLAACAAHGGSWPELQRQLLQVRTTTERAQVHDVDLANLLQLAGSLAAAGGQKRHARQALEAAMEQWRALGRRPQAKAVEDALKALG